MYLTNQSKTSLLILNLSALIYAVFCSSLLGEDTIDYLNYIDYARHSSITIALYYEKSILHLVANEPIWLLINILLSLLLSPENVVFVVSFFSAYIVAVNIFRVISCNKYTDLNIVLFFAAFIILMHPQIIKNFVIHLRQGLAIAFFVLGYFGNNKKYKIAILVTPFIHSSFFYVLFFYIVANLLASVRYDFTISFILLFITSIVIVALSSVVVPMLGARQAEQYFSGVALEYRSGIAFIVWLALLGLFISKNKKFELLFSVAGIVFYLISYYFLDYSARVFESFLPIILSTGFLYLSWKRIIFGAIVIFYILFYWLKIFIVHGSLPFFI